MKIAFDWLKEYIDLDISPEEAAKALSMLGLEASAGKSSRGGAVLDIEIASNRPDCLSVRGIARELAAARGARLNPPRFNLEESGQPADEFIELEIKSPLCPRYCARVVKGVKVGPGPDWLAERLEACGIRPVNNIVDATNYSLLATGHPLHAFDMGKISGGRILVRQAESGEKLRTLDGIERNLDNSMLVIADAEKPVALAGIMGGADTEVTSETADVLLEGAYFDPACVRRTAKALQMDTEASYRFQRGADIEDIIPSLDYASQLIRETSGGEVARGAVDRREAEYEPDEIKLRMDRVKDVLGAEVGGEFLAEKLSLAGFGVKKSGEGILNVSVPSWRRDIRREADFIEEAARFYGYDNIPKTMPSGEIPDYGASDELDYRAEAGSILVCAGFFEVVNNGLVSSSSAEAFGKCTELLNPLSSEQDALRPSLIPGLLADIGTNMSRGARGVKLFELGSVFPGGEEKLFLSGAACGSPGNHWKVKSEPFGYFDIKGAVEKLLDESGVCEYEFVPCGGGVFEEPESASVKFGDETGVLGKISAGICKKFGVEAPVYAFELDLNGLFKCRRAEKKFKPLPKFPPSFRDAAFVVGEEVESADIEKVIYSAGAGILSYAELFDIYRGKQIPPGSKSMAYSFCYRAEDRTLEDAEVSREHDRIAEAVMKELNAELRKD